jgi:hypothetical protein
MVRIEKTCSTLAGEEGSRFLWIPKPYDNVHKISPLIRILIMRQLIHSTPCTPFKTRFIISLHLPDVLFTLGLQAKLEF